MPPIPHSFLRPRPPLGRVRHFLITRTLPILLLFWGLLYLAVGLLFGFGYYHLGKLGTPFTPALITRGVAYHFSFTTQSTVGYGDYAPLAATRFFAALQSALGMVLNALAFGIVTYRFIRNPIAIEFPNLLVYDPLSHTFWFRLIDLDQDDLRDAHIRLELIRPSGGGLYDIVANLILLDSDVRAWIQSINLTAIRTQSNDGRPHIPSTHLLEPIRITPLDLTPQAILNFTVTAQLHSTGDAVFAAKTYSLATIRCGAYRDFNNNDFFTTPKPARYRAMQQYMNTIHSTPAAACKSCPFFPLGCPLDVATALRTTPTA